MEEKRRCTATTATGRPCRSWALREGDGDPTRCAAHAGRTGARPGNQNARTHGFYARHFAAGELADLVALADVRDLGDEIALARVTVRRLVAYIDRAEPEEMLAITALVMRSTGRIARLLRDQQLLTGRTADDLFGGLGVALDALNEMWGTEL